MLKATLSKFNADEWPLLSGHCHGTVNVLLCLVGTLLCSVCFKVVTKMLGVKYKFAPWYVGFVTFLLKTLQIKSDRNVCKLKNCQITKNSIYRLVICSKISRISIDYCIQENIHNTFASVNTGRILNCANILFDIFWT